MSMAIFNGYIRLPEDGEWWVNSHLDIAQILLFGDHLMFVHVLERGAMSS